MSELKAHQIAEATGGRLTSSVDGTTTVTSADTDSRQLVPTLFDIPARGEVTDGHDLCAAGRVAAGQLTRPEPETTVQPGGVGAAAIVDDSTVAMGELAHYIVAKLRELSETT